MLEKNSPKISYYLDKRYTKPNGTIPVKLRLGFSRDARLYPTKILITENDFMLQRDCEKLRADKAINSSEYNRLSKLKKEFDKIRVEAESKIDKIKIFSFGAFESKFISTIESDVDIYSKLSSKIEKLNSEDRIGTAETYLNTLKSFKSFYGTNELPISIITPTFLVKYEKWMIEEKGNGITTIGIYLRNLRAIINQIKSENPKLEIEYPFGRNKYTIPTKKVKKKAIYNNDLKRIFEYQPEDIESVYFKYWQFMYLGNGMNPYDMFSIKFSDIEDGKIHYKRKKTSRTNREEILIHVQVNQFMQKIIQDLGNKNSSINYLFPLFNNEMNSVDKKRKVANMVKLINKYMRKIAKKLKIDNDITTYVARHTFVTKLINSGSTVAEVKEMVGHANIATTESYIGGIEPERAKQISDSLLSF